MTRRGQERLARTSQPEQDDKKRKGEPAYGNLGYGSQNRTGQACQDRPARTG
jgi:hypothetical protein